MLVYQHQNATLIVLWHDKFSLKEILITDLESSPNQTAFLDDNAAIL